MKFNLEERLINFAVLILEITEKLPETRGSSHLSGQLVRCGTAPALHYGEAQSAESRKDFIHKMKIGLKELKETRVCLKLLSRRKLAKSVELISKENEELIAIVSKSIETAKKNKRATAEMRQK